MIKEFLEKTAAEWIRNTSLNRVQLENGEEISLFEEPLFGYASADDPLFDVMRQPQVIGPHFRGPEEWLAGSKSVISFFFPFSERVRASNRKADRIPSAEWLCGRMEGQKAIEAFCGFLTDLLAEKGIKATAPSCSSVFFDVTMSESEDMPSFTSNWSERHVAFICGLGTFGLSKGLITRRGIAGRFGSLVTDAELEPDQRTYTDIYERCIRCGACAGRCPAGAITLDKGKNHEKCYAYQKSIRERCAHRLGCGFCQTGVPCEHDLPLKESTFS